MYLNEKIDESIWVASSLFSRGIVNGSAANLSFRHNDSIFITRSDCSFGKLNAEDFSEIDLNGILKNGKKPSKECLLHLMLYQNNKEREAVLHTHSFYATLWSMIKERNKKELTSYTPYLKMKVGKVPLIPFEQPGTEALFKIFSKHLEEEYDAYLLINHGPIVSGNDIMEVFNRHEELEYTAKIAYYFENNQ